MFPRVSDEKMFPRRLTWKHFGRGAKRGHVETVKMFPRGREDGRGDSGPRGGHVETGQEMLSRRWGQKLEYDLFKI